MILSREVAKKRRCKSLKCNMMLFCDITRKNVNGGEKQEKLEKYVLFGCVKDLAQLLLYREA